MLEFGQRTLKSLLLLISAVVVLVAAGVAWLLLRMEKVWRPQAASETALSRGHHTGAGHDAPRGRERSSGFSKPIRLPPRRSATSEADLLARSVDELFVVNDNGTVRPVQPELYAATMSDQALQVAQPRRHLARCRSVGEPAERSMAAK